MSLLETKPWLWIALLLALVVALASCARTPRPDEGASSGTSSGAASSSPLAASEAPAPIDREALKARLTPMQWKVTQESGTERAYTGEYWDNHAEGIYVDIVDGTPLFSSKDKFDSGCGWPSFTQPLTESPLVEKSDLTHGMVRTEVRSKRADSHLGHVFDDGPKPTGLRYCINSASLRFVPVADLEKEGLGRFLPLFGQQAGAAAVTGAASTTPTTETAVLAGGCFWGMEDLLRKIPGVLETDCGYTGGHLDNPKYDDTHDSKSGHAEAVRIVFDPAKVSYDELLTWFFKIHDPTTLNRQGNDRGTQYRSAIFYASDAQKAAAERAIAAAELKWKKKIVTTLEPAAKWWPAEAYHQDYLVKNPRGYTCHYIRDL